MNKAYLNSIWRKNVTSKIALKCDIMVMSIYGFYKTYLSCGWIQTCYREKSQSFLNLWTYKTHLFTINLK
jgi:hypothetical protein